MSRTKSFAVNSMAAAILQISMLLVGLILPKIILTAYGSSINGLVTSVTQFISYLLLVEAGLSGAAIYALYKPLAQKNFTRINIIVATVHQFYKKSGYLFLILLIGTSFAYPLFIKCEELNKLQITILILVIGCKGVFDFFFMGKYRALLTADQKIFVVSFSSLASLFVNASIIISLAYYKFNIVTVYSCAVSALLIKTLILAGYVKSKYVFLDLSAPQDKTTLSQRWDVLYLQALGAIQQGIPIITLTLFTTLPIVSIYAIYNLVIVGLAGVLGIFINGLFSSFGDVIARKELRILQKSYSEFEFAYYTLITWTYTCAILLIVPFVSVYTKGITDANYIQPLFGFLIVLNAFFYNLKTPQGMLVMSAGLYRETRWQTTTQGAIAIILCFSLVQSMTLNGVILGVMAANIYRDIDLFFFIPKHVTKLPVTKTLSRVVRSMAIILLAALTSYYYPIDSFSFLDWVYHSILVTIGAGVITMSVNYFLEPESSQAIVVRIQNLVKSKRA